MKIGLIAGILVSFGLLAYAGDEESRLEGNWRGDSLCVADRTACRDEKVVYRIAKIPGKPDRLAITGDKIVNGGPITMGTLEFQYDREKHSLVCEYSQGVWRLKVNGNAMDGTLTRPDYTVFRHVTLKKED
jgi:hypothetical protein